MHYSQLVSAHFGDLSIVGPVGLKQGIGFPIQFFGDLGLWVAALVGLLELKANKDSQPVVLLISVYALGSVVFSFFYRPYWGYYLVHTAVFLVPFASVGFSLFCDILKSNKCILKSGVQLPGFRVQMNELAILTSLSLICGFTLGRAAYDVNAILSSKTPSQDPLIGEITRSKKGDSMLYTSRPYYGYYCNISLIPEYVVPSFKNVAQNQLNSSNLLVLVRERSVDMLHVLRDVELSDSSWIKYLNENCRLIYAGPSDELWIKDSKKLYFKKENKTEFVDWRLKSIVW
jgi:hypothetical protein